VRESAIGRLAFKDEPGKVRVFAMVDIVTQWIMKPLHDYLFSLLKTIRQDATFDQEKGIAYLQSMLRVRPVSFSFDLSAATGKYAGVTLIFARINHREHLNCDCPSVLAPNE
jgi:hypothetical protein